MGSFVPVHGECNHSSKSNVKHTFKEHKLFSIRVVNLPFLSVKLDLSPEKKQ